MAEGANPGIAIELRIVAALTRTLVRARNRVDNYLVLDFDPLFCYVLGQSSKY